MYRTHRLLAVAFVIFLVAGCTAARKAQPPVPTEPPTPARHEGGDTAASSFEVYDKVITDEAVSDDGLFTVHRLDEKLYYEIPDSLLGRELLLVSRIARTADEVGYGGEKANTHVVRWQRQGDDVLLRVVSYENVAREDQPIYEAVRNANFEPILRSFDIEAVSEDSAGVVIDVTGLFTEDVEALGLQKGRRTAFKVRRLDRGRSFITAARSYPRNVEVRHVLTYDAAEPPSNGSTGTISVEMNQSMVMLPEDPMTPRPCDDRVGYFSVERVNFGLDAQRAERECFITRWRLEPSDTAAFLRGELVEPVAPIVYYIDPATPAKWRPYLKQGVEDWNRAFEAAGFKNAILAKDPPTEEEDPAFSPEDVRYSVIRYFPSSTQNAYGPHVHDPRTGEILESDIGWFHNVMNLLRNWYFIQTAAVNPDARGVAFEEEVMGRLVRFVAAHEVGHTLGLPHNWGASSAYPVDSLRSASFTQRYGTAPSIMDYARFNYVAQPGDEGVSLMPDVGPYDAYAVNWGYRPILSADTPADQEPVLDAWIREHEGDPVYFYGRQTTSKIDPRSQNEDLGDDAVQASTYGLANLKRILPRLVDWTAEDGEDYDDLEELYGQVLAQWYRYMGHVVRNVGGVYETFKTSDQEGLVYEPVPAQRQRRAMAFLLDEAFEEPAWMLDEAILRRIEHAGALDRVRRYQVGVLADVLDAQRLARLIEAEALHGNQTYTAAEMLGALRRGLWRELADGEPIGPVRRNLQRGYLERMAHLMAAEVDAPPARYRERYGFTPVDVSQSDIPAYVRGELETLREEIAGALRRTTDRPTALHLKDATVRIDHVLDDEE